MTEDTEWRAVLSTFETSPRKWWVCEIDADGKGRQLVGNLDKPTAHLIAAAKDMQAALEDSMIDGHMNGCLQGARDKPPGDLCSPLCHKFRAALAKSRPPQ